MSITTIIIISLLLANLALTLIMFWIIHDLLSAVKSLQDMEELSKHAFDLCYDQITDYSNTIKKLFAHGHEICDSIRTRYDAVCDAYKLMRGEYDSIIDMNRKLLECWKGCEERYSQSYELFKHCSDQLKEVSFQLTDLANVSTEDEYYLTLQEACDTVCIDCSYGGLKCHDCPVWQLMHRDDIPDGTEGETPPDQEGMIKEGTDDYELTDEDYLEEGDDIAKD